jgi:hypothetical protein
VQLADHTSLTQNDPGPIGRFPGNDLPEDDVAQLGDHRFSGRKPGATRSRRGHPVELRQGWIGMIPGLPGGGPAYELRLKAAWDVEACRCDDEDVGPVGKFHMQEIWLLLS